MSEPAIKSTPAGVAELQPSAPSQVAQPAGKPAPAQPAKKPGQAQARNSPAPAQPAKKPAQKPGKPAPKPPPNADPEAARQKREAAQRSLVELRRKRARSLLVKLALLVALPTALTAAYAFLIASDSYESVALFSIQSAESQNGVSMEGLIGLAASSPSSRDTLAAREYVLSREMLGHLNSKLDLLDKYKSKRVDWLSRLPASASLEDAYEYYQDMVRVSYDSTSGVLSLRVRAFTASDAQRAAEVILTSSEAMVNQLSERSRQDRITFAERELAKAEARLSASRERLVELQQARGEFSPEQTAQAALSIRTQLESELANARAEYATLSSYMAKDSPQVIAARQRVASLSGQAQSESKRLVAPDSEGLNSSLVEFESVIVEKEFATHAYQSALTSLELARSDAARQHRYLAVIANPSLPDEAQYPRRFLLVLGAFLVALLSFGIGSLGIAAIKEHARL